MNIDSLFDWHDYNGRIHNSIHKWDMMSMRNAVTMSSTSKPPNFCPLRMCACVYNCSSMETALYIKIYSGTFFFDGKSAREEIKTFVWYRASVLISMHLFSIHFTFVPTFCRSLFFCLHTHTQIHWKLLANTCKHMTCTHYMCELNVPFFLWNGFSRKVHNFRHRPFPCICGGILSENV